MAANRIVLNSVDQENLGNNNVGRAKGTLQGSKSLRLLANQSNIPTSKMTLRPRKEAASTRSALTNIANKQNAHHVQPPKGKVAPTKPSRLLRPRSNESKLATVEEDETRMDDDEPMELEDDNKEDMDVDQTNVAQSTLRMAEVEDIDAEDFENPQLVVEFVNEIYAFMRKLENDQSVDADYFALHPSTVLKPRMRNMLVNWLVEVHAQFSLLQETLYLGVAILDRFLAKKANTISTSELQLVGITAMFIASKYEEMYPPEIGDFVYISDKAYTTAQIRRMEINILSCLTFDLGRPLPLNFLRRNSKAGSVDANTHTLAKFAMELCLVDYKFAHVQPSILAAAALAFSLKILDSEERSLYTLWTPTLEHYSSYSISDFADVLVQMAGTVQNALAVEASIRENSDISRHKKSLRSVTKKYSDKKFMRIAQIPELKAGVQVKSLVDGNI